MADVVEKFTFDGPNNEEFGILATNKLAAQDAAAFLNDEEVEEIVDKKDPKKSPPIKEGKDKEPEKEEQKEKKGASQQELIDLLSREGEEKESDDDPESEDQGDKKGNSKEKLKNEERKEDENTFATISRELLGMGVFTKDEDEDEEAVIAKTPEEFAQRFELEKKKGAIEIVDNFLASKGEAQREWFDNVMVKGLDPQTYMDRYLKIESISNLDITNPDDQERVVRENLRAQGYKPDAVENKLQRMIQNGELEEESRFAQEILLKKEKDALANDVVRKDQESAIKNQQRSEYVNNVSRVLSEKIKAKDFDGIPVDMKVANSVGHYLTAEKYQTPDGKKLTQFDKDILDLNKPENHPQKVKLALLMQLMREDPTFSKIQKKALSKESSKLFSKLERDNKKSDKNIKDKEESVGSWFPKN